MRKLIMFLLVVTILCGTGCSAAREFVEGFEDGMQGAVMDINEKVNKEISRGTINGNVYTSDYSGLTFTKPDTWVYLTDEELAEAMDIGMESLDQNAFADAVVQMVSVYDMMAGDNETGTNINIAYENLAVSNGGTMTEKEYLEALSKQLGDNATMNAEFIEDTTVTLCGNEYLRAIYHVDYSGYEMTMVYYLRSIDTYMNLVVVAVTDGYTIEDIEAMFE